MTKQKRKVILGIDIDNTTGDYTGALRKSMVKKFNVPEDKIKEYFPDPIDYDFSTWKYVSGDFKNLHSESVADGLYEYMDAYPKASKLLWKLSDEEYHIRVITSRYVKHHQNYKVTQSSAKWLDDKNIPYRDLMFVHEKTDVYVDVLVDDSPYNILGFQKLGIPVIIYDTVYNRNIDGLRAYNWDDVYRLVKELYPESVIEV